MAQPDAASSEENDKDGSVAQAQETLSSLFGRNTKMPGIPVVKGTIALPSFDSSNMKIDKDLVEPPQN